MSLTNNYRPYFLYRLANELNHAIYRSHETFAQLTTSARVVIMYRSHHNLRAGLSLALFTARNRAVTIHGGCATCATTTMRMFMFVVVTYGVKMDEFDVRAAYLHSYLLN